MSSFIIIMMKTVHVYIDTEGTSPYLMELACVAFEYPPSPKVTFGKPVDKLHMFCTDGLKNPRLSVETRLCHGIPNHIVRDKGVSIDEVDIRLANFLDQLLAKYRVIICGHGDDMTEAELSHLFKQPKWDMCHFRQVHLPNWVTRVTMPYHKAAYLIKQGLQMSISPCSIDNHRIPLVKPRRTPGQIAKADFGFHCAFIDCLELAMYDCLYPYY